MFKSYTKAFLSFIILVGLSYNGQAQILVNDTATAASLVAALVGNGISYSNPTLLCGDSSRGKYTVISSNLGLGDGIVLTSGKAKTTNTQAGVNGPQTQWFPAHCINEVGGDPELDQLGGITTFDACILEFDFIPDGDSLLFDYVFGSEEYDSYSCSGFNDVFGFFLSGPGLTGSTNVALIPGTNIPVAINSTTNPAITMPGGLGPCQAMGPGSPFAQYYNDNSNGQSITYYGMTTVLTARAAVIPCTTYHIKLAIADGGDCTLDSGVFLEANSFRSTNIKMDITSSLGSKYDYLVEGCTYGNVQVKRSTAFPIPQTVHLSYSGTTNKNVDYATVPDSVIIPANDTVINFLITPNQDFTKEGMETIVLNILNPCNGNIIDSIVFTVYDYLPYTLLSDDTALCQKEPVRLQVDGDTDFTWFWRSVPASTILNPNSILTYGYPDTTTVYYVSATYQQCVSDTQSFVATVEPLPLVDIPFSDTVVCLVKPMQIPVNIGPAYFNSYNYAWAPNIGLDDPFAKEPYFSPPNPGVYTYMLAVQTPLGCIGRDSVRIDAKPAVTLVNVTEDFVLKYGDVMQLNAEGADYYVWTPDKFLDFPNTQDPKATGWDSTTFQVIGMNIWGCEDTAYVKMEIDYTMFEIIPSAFSPNNDGRNDVFHIGHLKYQRLLEFRIFNRWGQEIFNTVDPLKGWDGTYKGVAQEAGVYNYLIRIATPDGKQRTFKGDVTLIR
jgi:gliding motility-associated-like protein